jgi:hypothetical protein
MASYTLRYIWCMIVMVWCYISETDDKMSNQVFVSYKYYIFTNTWHDNYTEFTVFIWNTETTKNIN